MTTPFGDFAVRPYVKADSGFFGGDLKMPLLVGQPGRRPGDMCLDDVAGSVKVRRGDQSILILGGAGGAPTWAQVIAAGNSSGANIVVNGNISMTTGFPTISTTGAALTLAPGNGGVNITGTTPIINFVGTGTIITDAGDLTLEPSSGVVDLLGSTLAFTAGAGIISTSVGNLTLAPSTNIVDITGGTLAFSAAGTVSTVGNMTLAPSSGIIMFPSTTVLEVPSGGDLILFAPGTGSINATGTSAAVPGSFLLLILIFILKGLRPTCTAQTNITGGTAGVGIGPGSNSNAGFVTATATVAAPLFCYHNISRCVRCFLEPNCHYISPN